MHSLVPTKLVYTTPNPQSANHHGAEKRLGLIAKAVKNDASAQFLREEANN
ncbi:MAG: hypothetical protein MRQ07_02555 [Candidatus Midichloria sp.]|nr:hypothetical protein [Candidatus Midichloria sp.]